MKKFRIGEQIQVTNDYEIETGLSETKLYVKKGDKGFIDCNGNIHYITGEARGKIHLMKSFEVKGYCTEGMANLIMKCLNDYDIKSILEDNDIEIEDFKNTITEALDEIF